MVTLRKPLFPELLQWCVVALAVGAALSVASYFSVFVLLFGRYPQDLAQRTSGFLFGLLATLAGARFAPRWKVACACIICVGATTAGLLYDSLEGIIPPGPAFLGGALASAFVAWKFGPPRSPRSVALVRVATYAALVAAGGLVYARYVDWPATPDEIPLELLQAAGGDLSEIERVDVYDRGGPLDEGLWRIEASADVFDRLIDHLGFHYAGDSVPPDFWSLPPYYWPASMPEDGVAYIAYRNHYCMVLDRAKGTAFVWERAD